MNRGDLHPGDAATRRRTSALLEDTHQVRPNSFRLTPADKVAIAYLVFIAVLISIFSYRIEGRGWLIAGHLFAIAVVALIAKWENWLTLSADRSPGARIARLVRGWYPVALIPVTYKELSYIIPLIHPRDFDTALAAIDHRVFGAHPTVWLERFTLPPLTEILQLTYSSYYLLPVVLGVVLWRKGWFEEFRFFVFIVVLGFYISYLGYIAVPAIGPRFLPEIVHAQTKPLTGVWLFQPVRETLDRAEGITRDCFPSGHTELTLLVLYYARRFHRKTFRWLLPFGVGIILSTVYLRYHYVIDVAAGALLAAAIVVIAQPLYQWLRGSGRARSQCSVS